MKNLNKPLMMLLIVGGLIFADDCLVDLKNTSTLCRGIISGQQVESTTSYLFAFNENFNSEITKTKNLI